MLRRSVLALNVRALHTSALRFAEKSALEVRLRDSLKDAMKARDKAAVSTLKAIIADVTYVVKSGSTPNDPATQETVVNTIRKGIAKRREAAESYAPGAPGASEEHYANFNNEIALLEKYMPEAPTPEAVQKIIDEIVASLETRNKGQTGSVMKALWERLGEARAAVDKKDVAARVAKALQ
ncbi:GatB/YqeY domain-containing protein [Cutaneotrichosporon oleaginosum]|uniref:Altered inheritance of mitochondria protein 41 n=1 Tax=Cutaneotrichosporon oleaginosum TaxID=879819 RepID=A0A0J0XJ07_9TREE|nr:GatB/YqeY domain-containing protein [Cutaneotrichosporon oleaginosum]KLT41056.1 GatB/YqeY domain-containing protein [Cutaneotrichosporon oleaginosum]TXT12148.1 hypothetical protein COLE_02558 [Cutaneotrichosporon oleaginosum]